MLIYAKYCNKICCRNHAFREKICYSCRYRLFLRDCFNWCTVKVKLDSTKVQMIYFHLITTGLLSIHHLFVCIFVSCDSDNSDMSPASTTNANCSPRWIFRPESRGYGATRNRMARTQQLCRDACVANSRCTTAEWKISRRQCWIHTSPTSRRSQHNLDFVQYDIVRPCYPPSGT